MSLINRLVGTTVVVVAAIVFIPNILDGEKLQKKEGFETIPERPEFKAIALDDELDESNTKKQLPKIPVVEEAAEETKSNSPFAEPLSSSEEVVNEGESDQPVVEQEEKEATVVTVDVTPAKAEVETIDVTETKQAEKAVPKRSEVENLKTYAWVVQLGSFSHKANVEALLGKLKENGFTAFTRPVKTPNGTLTKVFVGPELDKTKLEKALPKLKQLTKLDGRVTQFEITK